MKPSSNNLHSFNLEVTVYSSSNHFKLYALKSYDPESWMTIQKGVILAPKIVNLLEVKETMVKVSIPEGNKSSVKGWIPIDDRLWGVSNKETQILND